MASLFSENTNIIFIDTNLDMHLSIIELEHPSRFPKFRHIHIHAIKVKRKGYFYHLTDSLLVRNVFNGFNKIWFLRVKASALEEGAQSDKLIPRASPN